MIHFTLQIVKNLGKKANQIRSAVTQILTKISNPKFSYHSKSTSKPVAPKIQSVLKIFDQITPQTAISVFFLSAATTDAASSGRDVQTATIVIQINSFGTQKFVAILTALSTINFQPQTSQTSPKRIKSKDFQVGISEIFSSSFCSSEELHFLAFQKVYQTNQKKTIDIITESEKDKTQSKTNI